MNLPFFPVPELIVPGIVIFTLILTGKEAWTRCITANHANLSYGDHQDRIENWKLRAKGAAILGVTWIFACSLAYVITADEFWRIWLVIGLVVAISALLVLLFPLQLHLRHQKNKM